MNKKMLIILGCVAYCGQLFCINLDKPKLAPVAPQPVAPVKQQEVPIKPTMEPATPQVKPVNAEPAIVAAEQAILQVKAKEEAKKMKKMKKEAAKARAEAEKKMKEAEEIAKQSKDIIAANVEAAKIIVAFTGQRFTGDHAPAEKDRFDALYKQWLSWYADEDLADAVRQLMYDLEALQQAGVNKTSVPGLIATLDTINARLQIFKAEQAKRDKLDKSVAGQARRYAAKGARAVRSIAETEFGQAIIGFGKLWALSEAARRGHVNPTLLDIIAAQQGIEGFDAQALRDKELAHRESEAAYAAEKAALADEQAAALAATLKEIGFFEEMAAGEESLSDEESEWE